MATNACSGDSSTDVEQSSPPPPSTSSVAPLERTQVEFEIVQTNSDAPTRSALEYFIASFFQEKNIRWMLVIGAAIVFGSSLMLVTNQWSDWPAAAQYLTILGYTAAIFGFAELNRRHLGLLATAKVLHFLTLLLIPISFLSLSWLASPSVLHNTLAATEAIVLLIPATYLAWFASTRILDHWLQGRQTTFIISYVVLCMAGALPVITNSWIASIIAVILWVVMTAGVIKVNRHIFWMVEEYRAPRIFGFLPIGLLGLLFIMLMASKTWRAIHPEWIGLGCVGFATTVLITARSLASVYRQRTGDLVRPLPWNITVPMLVGIILVALGVLLSFYGFSYLGPTTTYAVVPTTLLAAALMIGVAKETRHSGFVWSALILSTVAYQSIPTLLKELVQIVKESAAQAIAEEKLPLAFYGLTYLPLLLSMLVGYRYFANRKQAFTSKPIQQFVTTIAFILFALSFTHLKALFLVSFINIFLFMLFAVQFRDRRYAMPALSGLVLVAATWIPLGNSMGWFDLSLFHAATSLASLACVLVVSRIPDRLLQRIPLAIHDHSHTSNLIPSSVLLLENVCRYLGLFLTFTLGSTAAIFVLSNLGMTWSVPQILGYGTILAAVYLSTISTRHYLSGLGFWILTAVGLSTWVYGANYPPSLLLSGLTFATTTISLLVAIGIKSIFKNQSLQLTLTTLRKDLGIDENPTAMVNYSSDRYPPIPQSLFAFAIPLGDLSFLGAIVLTAYIHLPMLAFANAAYEPIITPFATSMVMLWMLVLGLGFKNIIASVATFAMLPLWTTAILNTYFPEILPQSMFPLIWSLVAGSILMIVDRFPTPSLQPAKVIGLGWLAGIVALSFFSLDLPSRASGMIGLTILSFALRQRANRLNATAVAILGNLQLLMLIAGLGGIYEWKHVFTDDRILTNVLPWLLPSVAASILFFDRHWSTLDPTVSRAWSGVLRSSMVLGVAVCFLYADLDSQYVFVVFIGIIVAAVAEFCEAVRRQSEGHVWSSLATIGISVGWLAFSGVIAIGAGVSQFGLLGISLAALLFGERLRNQKCFGVIARPLHIISLILPALVTASAFAKECVGLPAIWRNFNTLALLSAAGIYFHHGLVTKHRGYHVAAGAILNITLALVWNSIQLYDFQLYLVPLGLSILGVVELLRKEIPQESHDPIRYLGALTILVSPIFEIMHGSWWHLFSLMVLSVIVILLAIGLRVRVLVYTGSAFLLADLVAMSVRTTIDHPSFLWVGGLGLGVAVITLAAICERHREQLLARIRFLSTELATWN